MSDLTDSLKWELKKNPFFQELDEKTFNTLLQSTQPKVLKARQTIFHEGDPGGSMLMILSGKIKISTIAANGKECVLAFFGIGDVIGEITLLDGGARTATAQAMEPSRILELTRNQFMSILESNPQIALKVIDILCRRLRATSRMVEDSTLLAAAPRLARTLLRLSRSHGIETDGGTLIDLPMSQSMLGAHAGLLRESVNRQLRAWEAKEILKRGDNKITILKIDVLHELTENTS
ncbi:MAG: Crp/Fnr family transcriptional regulator [Marinicaulis sp.]|nr:Crp/Fnr family transcriptional regulator [Marinicaulis sp.]